MSHELFITEVCRKEQQGRGTGVLGNSGLTEESVEGVERATEP